MYKYKNILDVFNKNKYKNINISLFLKKSFLIPLKKSSFQNHKPIKKKWNLLSKSFSFNVF